MAKFQSCQHEFSDEEKRIIYRGSEELKAGK